MGLLLLSLLIGCWEPASAQQLATVAHNDYRQDDQLVSLQKALQKLEAQFQVSLNYDYRTIKNRFVPANQLDELDLDVEKSLADILEPLDLQYKKIDKQYYIVFEKKRDKELFKVEGAKLVEPMLRQRKPPSHLHQFEQKLEKTLSGTVTDASDNSSLPGVNIVVKNTTNGTVTDIDGKYSLNVPDDAETLVFSSVGYISEEATIGNQTVINVQMAPDIQALEEVVVIGYGTQKKSVVTGAISSVKGADLENQQIGRIEQALQGRTSGLTIAANSGVPGAPSTVTIRGTTSLNNGANEPLYVVDGVVVDNSRIGYLSSNDIESIEVLKDAASAAIYGARSSAGVILITTKTGKMGSIRVNYNGYAGTQAPAKKLDLLNASQYATLINEQSVNGGGDIVFANPESYGQGTDWQSAIFNNDARIQSHEISISGGNKGSTFFTSFGLFDQEGIVATEISNFKRYNIRLNSSHKLAKWLTFGQTLGYSRIKRQGGVNGNSDFGGPLSSAIMLDPITPIVITDPEVANTVPYATQPVVRSAQGNPYGISELVQQQVTNPLAFIQTRKGNYGSSDDVVMFL